MSLVIVCMFLEIPRNGTGMSFRKIASIMSHTGKYSFLFKIGFNVTRTFSYKNRTHIEKNDEN